MKNTVYTFFAAICGLILLQSFDGKSLKKTDGTDPGYTGSPGDTLKNCTVCHGGTAEFKAGWISSNIPDSGFVPGDTYTVRAVNTFIGHNRFGFSISPQAIDGKLLGTMIITDTTRTKLVGNDKYITYRSAGVAGADSNVWVFDWKAPTDGTNEVVFYGAFNSNQDGHKGSDLTTLSTLTVYKKGFTGIPDQHSTLSMKVYPNPANDFLEINFFSKQKEAGEIRLFNSTGQEIKTVIQSKTAIGAESQRLDISHLENGIYFLQVSTGNKTATQKILIAR